MACAVFLATTKATAEHEAEVMHGDPLPWRTLVKWDKLEGAYTDKLQVFIDYFSSNAAEDILVGTEKGYVVYDVREGLKSRVAALSGETRYFLSWDYDGDGVAELLTQVQQPASYNPSETVDVMEAHALSGQVVGCVLGNPMGPTIVKGDFNGDKKTDLFMSAESAYSARQDLEARAFSIGGSVLFSAPPQWRTPYLFSADLDGDGQDELIATMTSLTGNPVLGIQGLEEGLEIWQQKLPDESLSWCADLNRDGTAELISTNGWILDTVSQASWRLRLLPRWEGVYLTGEFGANIGLAQLKHQRDPAIAATPGVLARELFVIWNVDGSLQYAEYLGELIEHFGVASDPEGDHIVLATQTKLLVWP